MRLQQGDLDGQLDMAARCMASPRWHAEGSALLAEARRGQLQQRFSRRRADCSPDRAKALAATAGAARLNTPARASLFERLPQGVGQGLATMRTVKTLHSVGAMKTMIGPSLSGPCIPQPALIQGRVMLIRSDS